MGTNVGRSLGVRIWSQHPLMQQRSRRGMHQSHIPALLLQHFAVIAGKSSPKFDLLVIIDQTQALLTDVCLIQPSS